MNDALKVSTSAARPADFWYEEAIGDYAAMKYRVEATLFSGQSPFQRVDVIKTKGYGRMLIIDGLVMITERDEYIYHDMITHVPLFVHPNPKRVLVIGGGDGGTAREVLRHPQIEKCVMVEIDGMVVDVSRQYLQQTACELDNPKLELLIADGVKYMTETEEVFDVVLIDSTDPIGPAAPLFGHDFYRNVHRVLAPNGIVVSQGESPYYELEAQRGLAGILKDIFPKVHIYNYSNMTYPGGYWSFTFASKTLCPLADFQPSRVSDSGLKFSFYTPGVHRGAFALPQFVLDSHADVLTPLET